MIFIAYDQRLLFSLSSFLSISFSVVIYFVCQNTLLKGSQISSSFVLMANIHSTVKVSFFHSFSGREVMIHKFSKNHISLFFNSQIFNEPHRSSNCHKNDIEVHAICTFIASQRTEEIRLNRNAGTRHHRNKCYCTSRSYFGVCFIFEAILK